MYFVLSQFFPLHFLISRTSRQTYSCAEDAAAFLEYGHLVRRLLAQAEFAGDKGGQRQVPRHWVFSSHGEIMESAHWAHQPLLCLLQSPQSLQKGPKQKRWHPMDLVRVSLTLTLNVLLRTTAQKICFFGKVLLEFWSFSWPHYPGTCHVDDGDSVNHWGDAGPGPPVHLAWMGLEMCCIVWQPQLGITSCKPGECQQ